VAKQQFNRLSREWDEMLDTHFHSARRNSPERSAGRVQALELSPIDRPQLFRPHRCQHHKLDRQPRKRFAIAMIETAKKLSDLTPHKRCVMLGLRCRLQRVSEVTRRIISTIAGGDCEPEDGRTTRAQSTCRLNDPATLNLLEHRQKFRWLDRGDRSASQIWEDLRLNTSSAY
jgi:hypothetical protein